MKKTILFLLPLLVALPVFSAPLSNEETAPLSAQDSLLLMKERLRISVELLRSVTDIIGDMPADNSPLGPLRLHEKSAGRPSSWPGSLPPRIVPADTTGEFIWIPDSLLGDWNRFLAQHPGNRLPSPSMRAGAAYGADLCAADSSTCAKSLQTQVLQALSPAQKTVSYVTFRGDTIPTVLKERKLGRFDRGLFNYLYIPRGIWSFGLTASYGELSTKDIELFDVVTGMTIGGHIFSISPYMQYFIRDNLSVGLRFSYTRGTAGVDSFNLEIDEDMSFSIDDINYKQENYKAAFTLRQYLGIDPSSRWGVFNEVELAFSSGTTDFTRPYDGAKRHLHATSMGAQLNFSPGVSVFIMKNIGFNVSFGVFGFSLKNEKQYLNDVYQGNRFTSGANFRFNIFNINFGLAVTI